MSNELRNEISTALNRASAENASGTPDFILADYLLDCLTAFDKVIERRATWRGESVELPALTALRAATKLVGDEAAS